MSDALPNYAQLEDLSDTELLERFQQEGDAECLGVLYNRYRHLAFGMALKYTKDRDAAEDMVNYVFTLLLEKLPGKQVFSFKQYLYGTVRNECLARGRRIRKEMQRQEEWGYLEKKEAYFMESSIDLSLIREPSLEEAVQDAVNQLGKEQQVCVRQFFFEGRSYKEIADETGYELKSVKSYLQNGKRNLKKLLEEFVKRSAS
jgi:RNA polymerase sigma-70 factor (ECF subfamily)